MGETSLLHIAEGAVCQALQGAFDWTLAEVTPEHRMATIAVVARMVNLVALGVQHSEDAPGDDEILVACTGFLETITSDFLPKADEAEVPPTTTSPPEPRLRAVKSREEGS